MQIIVRFCLKKIYFFQFFRFQFSPSPLAPYYYRTIRGGYNTLLFSICVNSVKKILGLIAKAVRSLFLDPCSWF